MGKNDTVIGTLLKLPLRDDGEVDEAELDRLAEEAARMLNARIDQIERERPHDDQHGRGEVGER